jgi:hypothetical protein
MLPRLSQRRNMSFSKLFPLALGVIFACLGMSASVAAAEQPIEGIWSFGGGAVAVQGGEDGLLKGTVVQETTFAVCPHPVGQEMWTEMKERPNGSYWGRHQWYRGSDCALDPRAGLAAWRVMQSAKGSKVLIVCLSDPGERKQPKIAPDGSVTDATYGCVESDPLAAIPGAGGKSSFDDLVRLPNAQGSGACRRSLTIVPRKLKYDPLKRLIVRFNGAKVADVEGSKRLRRPLVLNDLPEGGFKVRVTAITVLEQRRSRSRVFRGCRDKVRVPGKGKAGI